EQVEGLPAHGLLHEAAGDAAARGLRSARDELQSRLLDRQQMPQNRWGGGRGRIRGRALQQQGGTGELSVRDEEVAPGPGQQDGGERGRRPAQVLPLRRVL